MVAMFTPWLLLILLSVAELALGRGKPVDIFAGKGDILQLRGDRRGKFRNALYNYSPRKWNLKDSNGNVYIPYVITGYFDSNEHITIREAMNQIERNTCIRFIKRGSQTDYIDIQNRDGQGCYTNVGRVKGRGVVMLESNQYTTCVELPIVQHELFHVTGLWHEHMRHDRDNYIKVHYQNIKPEHHSQFHKVSTREATTYGIRYDYTSLMHYKKTAFGYPGMITMETKDPKYQDVIGMQRRASDSDYIKVCKIYGCTQCSGWVTNPPKPWRPSPQRPDGSKPKPWKPQPPRPTPSGCQDRIRFCALIIQKGTLTCDANGRKNCCATCKYIKSNWGWAGPSAFTLGISNRFNQK